MTATFIFDIPVYRVPEDQYYREMNDCIKKAMYPGPPEEQARMREHHANNPTDKLYLEGLYRDSYGGSWEYNEIIGFIRLHFLGTQIRGEYFETKPKRKVRTRTKLFLYKHWKLAPEIDVPDKATSHEIYKLICEYLENCSKEVPRRHIDTRRLDAIGSYINWHSLLKDSKNL